VSANVSCLAPLCLSNVPNIISCLIAMTSSAEHSAVSKIVRTSKTIWILVIIIDASWLEIKTTVFTSPISSLEGQSFSPGAELLTHVVALEAKACNGRQAPAIWLRLLDLGLGLSGMKPRNADAQN
jgi:hypothetical protein